MFMTNVEARNDEARVIKLEKNFFRMESGKLFIKQIERARVP